MYFNLIEIDSNGKFIFFWIFDVKSKQNALSEAPVGGSTQKSKKRVQ